MPSFATLLLAALFPALLIATLFYYLDKNIEPVREVLRAFGVGILSVFLTLFIGYFLRYAVALDGSFETSFINSFWNAAFVEELAKYSVFMLLIYKRKHFDEWYDGILYGIMVGLGFAFVENILYFSRLFETYGWMLVWTRSIFSMPIHALLGGIMGFFIGKARFSANNSLSLSNMWFGLLIPIALHGLFNFFLMFHQSQLSIISFILSLSLWFVVLKLKKRSQQVA
jgi:RsiW-degrading membrane proteinase PrsW (M82 family)